MTNNIVLNTIIKEIKYKKQIDIEEKLKYNDNIAKELCYDKSYLKKVFKKEIGLSIISYVNMIRIINSINMFQYDESLLKVCMFNGFNSLEYYSETFKIITGVNPTVYKKFLNNEEISKVDYLKINQFIIRMNTYLSYINEYKNGIKNVETFSLLLEKKTA